MMNAQRCIRRATLTAVLITFLSSCTPALKSKVTFDDGVDFEELRSFRFSEPRKDADPRLNDPVVHKRLRAAVEETLAGKGIRKAQTSDPDMVIGYRFRLTSKASKSEKEAPGFHDDEISESRATVPYVRQRDIGRLVLEMSDPTTGNIIWKGEAKGEVNFQQSTLVKGERAADAARKLLQNFPPRS